ncbi:Lrp/AsnC family transcriptional regulator [Streptomyces sp. H10-C2]|uniref:Lrp/AsnC family transcriptional regulator n=1 Tax=unclassified Streptomyces TaxID=2593676 RepID=UPI0024B9CE0E|nr:MULTISPECIES: Lrp/AsnC family transcriptional regulator [unclassified Streptomyces]MDJ0344015.1 Lrp/AsnC family transcriptional regulator [Streptomyces sp. PH10-H1]MDJ0373494.1 Lrp/AsnC family transcriptional regulator [Streptomyces sp. H10-C2]
MGDSAALPKEPRHLRGLTHDSSVALDSVDTRLLELVQAEGRITLSELGRRVSLSPAAVAERIRRLESNGTITGYSAVVAPDRLGYGMLAFVRVSPHGGYTLRHPRTLELMARPEILEVHHVVGEDCWILKVAVAGTSHLEEMLEMISALGRTTTSIVLSSPVERKVITPIDRSEAGR